MTMHTGVYFFPGHSVHNQFSQNSVERWHTGHRRNQ